MDVPFKHILAPSTDDPLADAETQAGWPEVRFDRPPGDWDLIEGELMTSADLVRDRPPIERLEGLRPGGTLSLPTSPGPLPVRRSGDDCLGLRRDKPKSQGYSGCLSPPHRQGAVQPHLTGSSAVGTRHAAENVPEGG